jgi:hypothetical protein
LAGEFLLDAGEIDEARSSLIAAFAARRDARSLFRLADATLLLGERDAAKRLYLQALLLDPFDPALSGICDDEVRTLPDRVRYGLDIGDEPAAWSAPAGIVEGALPRPAQGEARALGRIREDLSLERREALARSHAFVEALATAGAPHSDAIETRRTMKRLCPQLFEAYMDRFVRGRLP